MNSVHTAWKNPALEWSSLHKQAGCLLHTVLITNHWGYLAISLHNAECKQFFPSLADDNAVSQRFRASVKWIMTSTRESGGRHVGLMTAFVHGRSN